MNDQCLSTYTNCWHGIVQKKTICDQMDMHTFSTDACMQRHADAHTCQQNKVNPDSMQMKSHLRDLSFVFILRLPPESVALKGGINNEVIQYFQATMSDRREMNKC